MLRWDRPQADSGPLASWPVPSLAPKGSRRAALLGGHRGPAVSYPRSGVGSAALGVAPQRSEWQSEQGARVSSWTPPDAALHCPGLMQPLRPVFLARNWTVLWPFRLGACPSPTPTMMVLEGPVVLPVAGWHGLSSILTFASLHRPLTPPPFLPPHTFLLRACSSCLTLCDPTDCSPPDSSVRGISQARILGWVAISFLQGIFPTQGWNPCLLCLLHCNWILYC